MQTTNQLLHSSRLALLILVLALSLAACGGNTDTLPASESVNESSSGAATDPTADSAAPTLPVSDLPAPTESDSDSGSSGRPELGFALGDPNLKATNPSTVSLASGQIQVIEFFAFW